MKKQVFKEGDWIISRIYGTWNRPLIFEVLLVEKMEINVATLKTLNGVVRKVAAGQIRNNINFRYIGPFDSKEAANKALSALEKQAVTHSNELIELINNLVLAGA